MRHLLLLRLRQAGERVYELGRPLRRHGQRPERRVLEDPAERSQKGRLARSYQPDFIPSKRYTGHKPGYTFKHSYRGYGYYKDSASAAPARPSATPSLSAEKKAMRDGLEAFAADNSARELYAVTRDGSYPSHAVGAARYVANGASDSALDELVAEARKDATLKVARVTRSGGTLTSHGVIVWKPASTASGRRVYKLGKPLCENQAVSEVILRIIAETFVNLHAIETWGA